MSECGTRLSIGAGLWRVVDSHGLERMKSRVKRPGVEPECAALEAVTPDMNLERHGDAGRAIIKRHQCTDEDF